MNYRAVQGYIIASGFLNMYKEDSGLNEKQKLIYNYLSQLLYKYQVKNNVNIEKQVKKAWDRFNSLVDGVDRDISVLPFVCELIYRNPQSDKHRPLRNLTREVQKDFLFTKDDIIKDTKQLVRDFYSKSI